MLMPRALPIRPDAHRAVDSVIAWFDRDVAGPHARNAFSYSLLRPRPAIASNGASSNTVNSEPSASVSSV